MRNRRAISMTAKSTPSHPQPGLSARFRLASILLSSLLALSLILAFSSTSPVDGAALNAVGKVRSNRDRGK